MNIRIGDKVKILDREMPKYFRKTGKVMDVGWTIKYKKVFQWKPKWNDWFREDQMWIFDKEIIGFDVDIKENGLPIATFAEENLVAFK